MKPAPSTPTITPRAAPATAALVAVVLLSSCSYEKVVYDPWGGFPADPKAADQVAEAGEVPTGLEGWSILLESFEGQDAETRAARLLRRLEREAGINDAWAAAADGRISVYRGRFIDPSDAATQAALQQTRALVFDGLKPYEFADLTPLSPTARASADPLDLRSHPGMFTLQIGFYDDAFGPDFRQAAQRAAAELRRDGEEAYYYHGPNRSLVTVGLFGEQDFEQQGPQQVYGPRMRELREKYPYNLGNGLTLVEKDAQGNKIRDQPSFLVRINQ